MDLKKEWNHLKISVLIPLTFVILVWAIKIFEEVLQLSFAKFGVLPRAISGLKGILLMPFIHGDSRVEGAFFGDFSHVFHNSSPMLVLGFLLLYMYRKVAVPTIAIIWFLGGALVWAFARGGSVHIGASGVIYGLAAFIFGSGVIRRDAKSIALSLLVAFFYGGMVWGVLPIQPGVSYEGHLFGAIAGFVSAYIFRNVEREKKHEWNEPDEKGPIVEDPFWVKKEVEEPMAPPAATSRSTPTVDVEDELEALKRRISEE